MRMFENVPTFEVDGVPDRRPVLVEKLAQAGRFVIENVSESPSASAAVGVKLYAVPAVMLAGGTPEIVGARFAGGGVVGAAVTWMRNDGSEALSLPSDTEIVMLPDVPTFAAAGVPVTAPVLAFRLAQVGRPVAEKLSGSPSASLALGVNA